MADTVPQWQVIDPNEYAVGKPIKSSTTARQEGNDRARARGDSLVPAGERILLPDAPVTDIAHPTSSVLHPDGAGGVEWVAPSDAPSALLTRDNGTNLNDNTPMLWEASALTSGLSYNAGNGEITIDADGWYSVEFKIIVSQEGGGASTVTIDTRLRNPSNGRMHAQLSGSMPVNISSMWVYRDAPMDRQILVSSYLPAAMVRYFSAGEKIQFYCVQENSSAWGFGEQNYCRILKLDF